MKNNTPLLIVDLRISANSPAGSLVKRMALHLRNKHSIELVTSFCDDEVARHFKVHLISGSTWPLVLRYRWFRWRASAFARKWRAQNPSGLIIGTQGQCACADVVYAHYCHEYYLKHIFHATPVSGLRRLARKANHWLSAREERRSMLSARKVVAVSESLADEIMLQYGKDAAAKLKVIHNPIDTDFWTPLAPLIRKGVREQLGFPDDSKVITFVALGDFERKGLPVLLEAISILRGRQQDYRVLAVGPTAESIMSLVHKSGLDPAVVLAVGPQRDVRPYYAAADAFCLPSMYESASLVMLEARASGLPLVVAQVGYAKGLTESGGGILIDRTAASVAQGLHQVLASQSSSPYKLPTRYEIQHFYAAWEALVTENCVARIEPFR